MHICVRTVKLSAAYCEYAMTSDTVASMAKPVKAKTFPHAEVGRRIREARERLSPPVTMIELSRRIGVSSSTAFRYETGATMPPGDTLALIANQLGVSAWWLTQGTEPPSSESVTELDDVYEAAPGDLEDTLRAVKLPPNLEAALRRQRWSGGPPTLTDLITRARSLRDDAAGRGLDRTEVDRTAIDPKLQKL